MQNRLDFIQYVIIKYLSFLRIKLNYLNKSFDVGETFIDKDNPRVSLPHVTGAIGPRHSTETIRRGGVPPPLHHPHPGLDSLRSSILKGCAPRSLAILGQACAWGRMIRMIHPVLGSIILKNRMIDPFCCHYFFVWLDFPVYHPAYHPVHHPGIILVPAGICTTM